VPRKRTRTDVECNIARVTPRPTTRRRRARARESGAAARRRAAQAGRTFARLVRLISTLRSPRGCPWDRKQTPRSLRRFLLEETYEALEAIDRGQAGALCGELGDVLFQCVFQGQIAAEAGRFDITASIQSIIDKLVRRHPHVFTPGGRPLGTARRRRRGVRTPAAVLVQWEQLKAKEQQAAGARARILAGVPRALPALARAHEISTRVAAVGFDWPSAPDVMDKIEEEVRELRGALDEHPRRAAEELGDLLFSIANLARKLGLEPESALREANDKFTTRFAGVESLLEGQGRSVHDSTLEEMERAWAAVKTAAAARPAGGLRRGGHRAP
jgi:MazG family protein